MEDLGAHRHVPVDHDEAAETENPPLVPVAPRRCVAHGTGNQTLGARRSDPRQPADVTRSAPALTVAPTNSTAGRPGCRTRGSVPDRGGMQAPTMTVSGGIRRPCAGDTRAGSWVVWPASMGGRAAAAEGSCVMATQVMLTEAEVRAFSSLLGRVSERLAAYEQQTHQDQRYAEELQAAAGDLLSRLDQNSRAGVS